MLFAAQKAANAVEVYWLPRSLWNITPGAGRRVNAMVRASVTRSVRMWSATA